MTIAGVRLTARPGSPAARSRCHTTDEGYPKAAQTAHIQALTGNQGIGRLPGHIKAARAVIQAGYGKPCEARPSSGAEF